MTEERRWLSHDQELSQLNTSEQEAWFTRIHTWSSNPVVVGIHLAYHMTAMGMDGGHSDSFRPCRPITFMAFHRSLLRALEEAPGALSGQALPFWDPRTPVPDAFWWPRSPDDLQVPGGADPTISQHPAEILFTTTETPEGEEPAPGDPIYTQVPAEYADLYEGQTTFTYVAAWKRGWDRVAPVTKEQIAEPDYQSTYPDLYSFSEAIAWLHGVVHKALGGVMLAPRVAACPIFYPYHASLLRMWELWSARVHLEKEVHDEQEGTVEPTGEGSSSEGDGGHGHSADAQTG